MLEQKTPDGKVALIEWALHYYNTQSGWQQTVGGEIATWLQMPEIILGLHFEAELGKFFEYAYHWHCQKGPIRLRSGFRMMEIFDLYFSYELPWWNQAVNHQVKAMPNTSNWLNSNFIKEKSLNFAGSKFYVDWRRGLRSVLR